MNEYPLISIILPVYNLEKYIEKCLYSLLAQEYSNIEIIICDDNSSDNTFNICKRIAETDNRIVLIKNEYNFGVSVSRNNALDIATGEFVCFVDGDDIVSKDSLTLLLSNYTSGCCFSEARLSRIQVQELVIDNIEDSPIRIECHSYLSNFLRWKTSLSCCGKLFKKSLIGLLRFAVDKRINEDRYFLFQYLINHLDKEVVFSNKIVYGVFERIGSSGRSGFSEKYKDMFFISKCILDDSTNTSFYEDAVFNDIVTNLMFLKYIIRLKKYNDNKELFAERKRYILSEYKQSRVKLGLRQFELFILRCGNPFYFIYVKVITKILRRKTY